MTSGHEAAHDTDSACVIRWVFRRGSNALTCAVEAGTGQWSYDVWILPHWNVSEAIVEHFEGAADALLRHAEITSQLRQHGWVAQSAANDRPSLAA